MSSVNKVILLGRLGQDPQIAHTKDGTAVANLSLATSETWKDKNTGEKREKTEWHRITAFKGLAEVCGRYLSKGSQIYCEGKLQTREYEKDGEKKYITEIVMKEMTMLGGGQNKGQENYNSGSGYENKEYIPSSGGGEDDGDIPF